MPSDSGQSRGAKTATQRKSNPSKASAGSKSRAKRGETSNGRAGSNGRSNSSPGTQSTSRGKSTSRTSGGKTTASAKSTSGARSGASSRGKSTQKRPKPRSSGKSTAVTKWKSTTRRKVATTAITAGAKLIQKRVRPDPRIAMVPLGAAGVAGAGWLLRERRQAVSAAGKTGTSAVKFGGLRSAKAAKSAGRRSAKAVTATGRRSAKAVKARRRGIASALSSGATEIASALKSGRKETAKAARSTARHTAHAAKSTGRTTADALKSAGEHQRPRDAILLGIGQASAVAVAYARARRRAPIQTCVDIAVPLDVAYAAWMELDFLPEGSHRVEEIERDGEDRLSGKINRGWHSTDWAAEILDERDGESFAWRSDKGSDCAGLATFHRLSDRLTRVELQLDVIPVRPTETLEVALGAADRRAQDELRRFKARLETISPDAYEEELENLEQ